MAAIQKKTRTRREPTLVADEAIKYGIPMPNQIQAHDRFISPNQAGKILNLTGEAVKQWIYHRRLPATKLSNGYWKIRVADLQDYIRSRGHAELKKVMIVDDHPSAKEIAKAIEQLGHQAVIAVNQTDAMLKAIDIYPALFVVSLSIKSFDPWALLERIRTTRNLRTAAIMLMSEKDLTSKESEKALELSVQGFINRPMKTADIVNEIQGLLHRTR